MAGLFIPVAAFPAAVYSSRELALPGDLFHVLTAINHFGTLLFGVAMLALFLIYPRRLVSNRALWLLSIVFGGVWILDTLQFVLCAGTFVSVIILPNLFGVRLSISQGYVFVLLGILLVGVAVGLARHRN